MDPFLRFLSIAIPLVIILAISAVLFISGMRADRPPGQLPPRRRVIISVAIESILLLIVIGIARGGGITQIDWRGAAPIVLFAFAVTVVVIMLLPLPGSRD